MAVVGGCAHHGKRAALARANAAEGFQIFFENGQHIALLRFVAPNLHRAQTVLFQRHIAQFKHRAAPGIVYQFGKGVGEAARAHVVDRHNRVGRAQLPAAVDHFLRAPLDFGVAALHRVEIQIGLVGAGVHARSRAAAQADEHAGAAELDEQCAFGDFVFMRLLRLNATQAAGEHNRLVVAAHLALILFFKGAEIAQKVGAAEFVVERGAANRPFEHDVERAADVAGFAVGGFDGRILLPRLLCAGNVEVGHAKAGEAGFGARAFAGGAFIADFTARAGGRAGKGRDGGGVIVGFHFHDDVGVFFVKAVGLVFSGAGIKALDFCAFNHGRVVFISHHRALGVGFVGVAYHAEQ